MIFIIKIVFILISIAYFTVAERKIMAAIQRRKGPNVVGIFGIGQPLADGLKLLIKEIIVPTKAEKKLFIFSPLLIIILGLSSWILIPGGCIDTNFFKNETFLFYPKDCENLHIWNQIQFIPNYFYQVITAYTLLFILAISSLNVYGIISAGWSSYSKYAFLGALRSSAQMISYEVSIGLVLLPIILINTSFNFTEFVLTQILFGWNSFLLLPLMCLFFISLLAETNRTPFDLPEAEAELVAGYNVEYSSIIFAMFFLGEYSNMLVMSVIFSILFLGGWDCIFLNPIFYLQALFLSFKTILICFGFILIRALVPRYKYNQLMNLGWKFFLPFSLSIMCSINALYLFI